LETATRFERASSDVEIGAHPLSYAAMEEKLILKRASASRPSQEWNDDDYDVLSDRSRRVSVENEWSSRLDSNQHLPI
jgi:hypothetical protein